MMKAVAVLLLIGLVAVSAYTEDEYRSAFTSWMQKHSKAYTNTEFQNRYTIFKNNMDYVRDWNAKNSETIRMSPLSSLLSSFFVFSPFFSFFFFNYSSFKCKIKIVP
jgi:hypothetical protein